MKCYADKKWFRKEPNKRAIQLRSAILCTFAVIAIVLIP